MIFMKELRLIKYAGIVYAHAHGNTLYEYIIIMFITVLETHDKWFCK